MSAWLYKSILYERDNPRTVWISHQILHGNSDKKNINSYITPKIMRRSLNKFIVGLMIKVGYSRGISVYSFE